ncbi:MAG: heavy-metal-associated domain-containing protein [Coriobacteriia bacterium]
MAELTTTVLSTSGMHCRSCSMMIDMTLGDLEGVENSQTDLASGKTEVAYDPDAVTLDDIRAAIRGAGYDVE